MRRYILMQTLVALAVAGCAAPTSQPWRVAPSYRVSIAGQMDSQAYAALARQYEGEGRWADALQTWRKAAAAEPDNAEVLDRLGIALAGQGRRDEAVTALYRAVELAPAQARLLNNLGYALILAGRGDEARAVLRKAMALDPAYEMAGINLRRLDSAGPTAAPATSAGGAAVAAAAPQQPPAASAGAAETVKRLEFPAQPTPMVPAQSPAVGFLVQTEPNVPPLRFDSENLRQVAFVGQIAPTVALRNVAPAFRQLASDRPSSLNGLRIEIANGNGIDGMAAWLGSWLQRRGLDLHPRLTNLRPFNTPTTIVYYRSGFADAAHKLARRMPQEVDVKPQTGEAPSADVRVVLGHDLRRATACTSGCRDTNLALVAVGQDETPIHGPALAGPVQGENVRPEASAGRRLRSHPRRPAG